VIDFGTATTFNVINGAGEFVGGAISPGLNTCSEALFSRAAKLPRVEFARPAKIIGSSTVAAIQSGLFHGYAGLVDALTMRMIDELGEAPRVIATGGLAHAVAAASPSIHVVDDTLTLEGLRLVYERISA
jgi:type III pantothenate kinase